MSEPKQSHSAEPMSAEELSSAQLHAARMLSVFGSIFASVDKRKEAALALSRHFQSVIDENENLRAQLESANLEKQKALDLVASYDRQDELIGTEFEGVDEVTEVIRLLKLERDEERSKSLALHNQCEGLKSQLESAKKAQEWVEKWGPELLRSAGFKAIRPEWVDELRELTSKNGKAAE